MGRVKAFDRASGRYYARVCITHTKVLLDARRKLLVVAEKARGSTRIYASMVLARSVDANVVVRHERLGRATPRTIVSC